jgi:hypothetical protein
MQQQHQGRGQGSPLAGPSSSQQAADFANNDNNDAQQQHQQQQQRKEQQMHMHRAQLGTAHSQSRTFRPKNTSKQTHVSSHTPAAALLRALPGPQGDASQIKLNFKS